MTSLQLLVEMQQKCLQVWVSYFTLTKGGGNIVSTS